MKSQSRSLRSQGVNNKYEPNIGLILQVNRCLLESYKNDVVLGFYLERYFLLDVPKSVARTSCRFTVVGYLCCINSYSVEWQEKFVLLKMNG